MPPRISLKLIFRNQVLSVVILSTCCYLSLKDVVSVFAALFALGFLLIPLLSWGVLVPKIASNSRDKSML